MSGGPLSHIRVLDLTQRLAGPYGTQMLGDLGAEIIKLEPPGGDPTHKTPPHFVGGESTYYLSFNRNKRSVIIDLKEVRGRELMRELLGKCDVLVENNRPGAMARLGLDYATLKKDFPGLVYCSISGFGQDGPDAQRGALDPIVQAISGGMSLTGEVGGKAVRAGIPIGDICAGMYAATGILAALLRREKCGQGEFVDISMLDAQIAMLGYQGAAYLASGKVPGLQGRTHDSYALAYCVSARDGVDVMIAANAQRAFEVLAKTIGRTEIIDDPRFLTPADRNRNKAPLRAILDEACVTVDSAAITAAMHSVGSPAAVINSIDRALTEPQVIHRQMVLDLQGGDDADYARVPGDPIKLTEAQRTRYQYPPHAGQHTREVLKELLGYSDARIDTLSGVALDRPVDEKTQEF
ncbi:MAG: CoA transferase [Betaproteobacteria bacterium]|nr:CoA transferase [Betaproteobacteria bacterium]